MHAAVNDCAEGSDKGLPLSHVATHVHYYNH